MTATVQVKSLTLDQLAEQIKPHLAAMDEAEESALVYAKNAGRWLKVAKARCRVEAKPWNKWVPRSFAKTKQMADAYIRVFDHWPEIEAEMGRTGKGMTVRAAIAFLARSEQPQGENKQEPPPEKKKQKVNLDDRQKAALQAFLDARGVQSDPVSFMSTLSDLDINLKSVVNRIDILAIQLKEKKLGEWLNSFVDGYPAWEEACDSFGVDPEVMAAAAAEAGEEVYGWHYGWWEQAAARPGPEYDTLIAGIDNDWYYFVNSHSFNAAELAHKTAEWLIGQGQNYVDDDTLAALEEKLAAQPAGPGESQPTQATVADGDNPEPLEPSPTEPGPAGALPPTEEPPPPSPKRRRR